MCFELSFLENRWILQQLCPSQGRLLVLVYAKTRNTLWVKYWVRTLLLLQIQFVCSPVDVLKAIIRGERKIASDASPWVCVLSFAGNEWKLVQLCPVRLWWLSLFCELSAWCLKSFFLPQLTLPPGFTTCHSIKSSSSHLTFGYISFRLFFLC